MIGSLRGGELTWRALERNLLRPNNAHLALLLDRGTRNGTLLHRLANFVWETEVPPDWASGLDGVAASLGVEDPKAWRRGVVESNQTDCITDDARCMQPKFLGPVRWSAAINMLNRYEVKRRLQRHGLLRRYGTFVVTRFDQFFGCPLYLSSLDAGSVWIPDGEDYGGVTDRLIICSRADVIRCTSIVDGFLAAPSKYHSRKNNLGPEKFFLRRLKELQLWPRVKRFPRTMFTAAVPGDSTRWSVMSAHADDIYNVHLKYEFEYVRTKWACGLCHTPGSPYCCGNLDWWWAKALADAIDMRTQVWDENGTCKSMGWAKLLYTGLAAAVGAGAYRAWRRAGVR